MCVLYPLVRRYVVCKSQVGNWKQQDHCWHNWGQRWSHARPQKYSSTTKVHPPQIRYTVPPFCASHGKDFLMLKNAEMSNWILLEMEIRR